MDALLGNRKNVFKDIMVKTRNGVGCGQLAYILTKQDEVSEPLWRAGLSIAKFCEDADRAARKISENHREFSLKDTMDKMDRIKGPYSCSKFDEFNSAVFTY